MGPGCSGDQPERYGLASYFNGASAANDSCSRLLLRWTRALKERLEHHDDELCSAGRIGHPMGRPRIFLGFWLWQCVSRDFSMAMLSGVGLEASGTIPHLLFMAFQGTFAIITAALISGAVVERMRFASYMVFIALWGLVVYAPVCHWVWGGGWLGEMGALDFAGGAVVHVNAGVAAMVAALVLGSRKDYGREALLPHNVPFVLLGAGVLWFGWFGFNGGSALAADGIASLALVNTLLAPAGALLGWTILDHFLTKKITAVGVATAIVVGLVAITPAAGFVTPIGALGLGVLSALPSYFIIRWRTKTRLDDSLDVFAAHGRGWINRCLVDRCACHDSD